MNIIIIIIICILIITIISLVLYKQNNSLLHQTRNENLDSLKILQSDLLQTTTKVEKTNLFELLPYDPFNAKWNELNIKRMGIIMLPYLINYLFINNPPWGIYFASDWDGANILYEARNNGRNAITKGVRSGKQIGNGSAESIPYLFGDTNASIQWPEGSIPEKFTICSITRYTGGSNQRILQSSTGKSNWFHGHDNNNSGVVYYENWMTPEKNNVNVFTDWVVTCGKNGSNKSTNIFVNNINIDSNQSTNILVNDINIGNNNNGVGGLQLGINIPNGGCCPNKTSNWALSVVFIWDTILTDNNITSMSTLLNRYLINGVSLRQVLQPYLIKYLLINKPPWGIYFASDWDGENTLYESRKNGRNATTKNITYSNKIGIGSAVPIPSLSGDTNASIQWPNGSIPEQFTICSITRYTGGANQRILQSSSVGKSNWFHGHNNNNNGVVYYESWMTPEINNVGAPIDWVVTCGKNASTLPNNIWVNNKNIGNNNNGVGGLQLGINVPNTGCCSNETSNWAFNQVYIWDQILTDIEIKLVSNALTTYLLTGKPI